MKQIRLTAVVLLFHFLTLAQDTHYETYQFGARSALLGGAVVGGTRDNSMIFYNPAAIAFIDSSSFSINANMYQVENTHIKNAVTEERDFKSSQVTTVPLLTSGQFKTKVPYLRVSYGVYSPVAFQFRGQARIAGVYPIVSDDESPGKETFLGDENLFSRVHEINIALGISYKLNDHWSVGLTNLFDVRSHYYNRSGFTYYYLNDANHTLVSTSLTQSFNYYNVRYMPKVGLAFRSGPWSWGATATAPGIRMMGTGALGVDILATNVNGGGAERGTILANGRQTKVKSYFKSPFSIATGIQFPMGHSKLFFSTEYFGKQGVYNVLRATEAPFVSPANIATLLNSDSLLQVNTAARALFNFALGFEHPLNEKLTLNAGIRTNRTYYDPQLLYVSGIKPDISTWDLYHVVGGVTILKERSSMSLGLAYAFGTDKNRSAQYLPLPSSDGNFYKSPITSVEATYNSLGVVVGFNYFLKKG
jgi:long-subunit fatty acid transport protein